MCWMAVLHPRSSIVSMDVVLECSRSLQGARTEPFHHLPVDLVGYDTGSVTTAPELPRLHAILGIAGPVLLVDNERLGRWGLAVPRCGLRQ